MSYYRLMIMAAPIPRPRTVGLHVHSYILIRRIHVEGLTPKTLINYTKKIARQRFLTDELKNSIEPSFGNQHIKFVRQY